jgi:hypothetical protein
LGSGTQQEVWASLWLEHCPLLGLRRPLISARWRTFGEVGLSCLVAWCSFISLWGIMLDNQEQLKPQSSSLIQCGSQVRYKRPNSLSFLSVHASIVMSFHSPLPSPLLHRYLFYRRTKNPFLSREARSVSRERRRIRRVLLGDRRERR